MSTLGDGCRLVAHVNVTGHTTIGARTVIYPFASLGSPPQSVQYRGGPTRLVVGADCDIRENVTMNTGTEDGGGVTEVGDHCFFMVGSHVGARLQGRQQRHRSPTTSCSAAMSRVGDYVVFGGGVAVRQFVRIGEGAMIVGLSGVRADVIPWGMAQGPLAQSRRPQRRRHAPARLCQGRHPALPRRPIARCFSATASFARGSSGSPPNMPAMPLVGKMIDFIRAGKRPLTMARQARRGRIRGRMSAAPAVDRAKARSRSSAAAAACRWRSRMRSCARGRPVVLFRVARRRRSGRRRALSASLAAYRPDRQVHAAGARRRLPRRGVHRLAGAAVAVAGPARSRRR